MFFKLTGIYSVNVGYWELTQDAGIPGGATLFVAEGGCHVYVTVAHILHDAHWTGHNSFEKRTHLPEVAMLATFKMKDDRFMEALLNGTVVKDAKLLTNAFPDVDAEDGAPVVPITFGDARASE